MNGDGDTELGVRGLRRNASAKGSEYGDSSGGVWSVYLSEADKQDKALAENWKGDTEGILIFTGLFAATVAAFIIESYKTLSPDSEDATVFLLNQISQQLSSVSNGTQPSPPPPFRPTSSAIRVNILWFLSLTLSLVCALSATLMQQWARRYLQLAKAQATPHKRARTRAYLFEGVQTFRLSQVVEAVPALLHVAVFLFFTGLIDFLFNINDTVARVVLSVLCFFGGAYILLTFLPNLRPNCPYRTPFSWDLLKWLLFLPLAPVSLGLLSLKLCVHSEKFDRIFTRFILFVQSLLWTMSEAIRSLQTDIDKKAIQWTVATIDDDDDLEAFVEGIPGFLVSSTNQDGFSVVEDLLEDKSSRTLGRHINRLFQTCIPEGQRGTSEVVRRHRAMICLDTVRFLTTTFLTNFRWEIFGNQTWSAVNSLKRDEDPVIAISAVSTSAMAACAYLRSILDGRAPSTNHSRLFNELVNAPWPKDELYSHPGCYFLILGGYIGGLLPHLRSEEMQPANFRVVWSTLPTILNKMPPGRPEPVARSAFLLTWDELAKVAGTTEIPDIQWGAEVITGSAPLRFRKRIMGSDGLTPVLQLMSILRPVAERLRELAAEGALQAGIPQSTGNDGSPIPSQEAPVQTDPSEPTGPPSLPQASSSVAAVAT